MPFTNSLLHLTAFDDPPSKAHRSMAKLLILGLLRTQFSGKIVVFRNSPEPLFKVQRWNVEEVLLPMGKMSRQEKIDFRYQAHAYLDLNGIDVVTHIDADCAVMRNIDHLFPPGNWDILHQPEQGRSVTLPAHNAYLTDEEMVTCAKRIGSNGGNWAVKASHYVEVMQEWDRISKSPSIQRAAAHDQHSWNRLLLDTKLKTQPFERDEIQFPSLAGTWQNWRHAAILHVVGGTPEEKLEQLAGFFYSRFFSDPSGHFIDLLEP